MSLVWAPKLMIGHPKIDDDHRWLIESVHEFNERLISGKSPDEAIAQFNEIHTRIITHFKEEEELQAQISFQGLIEHRRSHAMLLKNIKELQSYFLGNLGAKGVLSPMEMVPVTAEYVRNWLLNHILEEDMQMRPALMNARRNGIIQKPIQTENLSHAIDI